MSSTVKSLSYDDTSRLATVTQGNRVATYTHGDALETIDQVRIASSGTERYRLSRNHDNLGRVTRIDTLGNETTLYARRDYLHNNANLRTEVTEDSGRKWSFDYDSLGQVTAAQKLDGASEVLPGFDFGYTFDDIGNRVSTTVNERTASYSSNAINQYTQRDHPGAVDVRGHAPEHVGVIVNSERTERTDGDFYAPATGDNSTASVELDIVVKALDPGPPELLAEESRTALLPQDPESFIHDLDGNLTQDGLWTYEWDAENRLIAMESRTDLPASVVRQRLEFAYDSRSRRIEKTVKEYDSGTSSWTTTEQTKFLYDGWNLLAEYDALNSDVLTRSHAWGLDLSGTPQGAGGVGGLLWSSQSGADYAPGFDGNGNIIAWVDLSDGTLAGTSEYGAFGETLASNGISAEMPFGFSTKYEDSETELLYYGYRFYSPSTGRWPSRDPINEQGGVNLYAMDGNDAVNALDYLGMTTVELIGDPEVILDSATFNIQVEAIERGYFGRTIYKRRSIQVSANFVVPTTLRINVKVGRLNTKPGPGFGKYNLGDLLSIGLPAISNPDPKYIGSDFVDGKYLCYQRIKCKQKCKTCKDGKYETKTVEWRPGRFITLTAGRNFIPGALYRDSISPIGMYCKRNNPLDFYKDRCDASVARKKCKKK